MNAPSVLAAMFVVVLIWIVVDAIASTFIE